MEMSPDTSPAKRTRAKPKTVTAAAEPAAAKKTPSKAAPRKKSVAKESSTTPVAAEAQRVAEDMGSMIATAAYYLAAARNFSPGHELDDWLEAERAVQAKRYG